MKELITIGKIPDKKERIRRIRLYAEKTGRSTDSVRNSISYFKKKSLFMVPEGTLNFSINKNNIELPFKNVIIEKNKIIFNLK